MELRQYWHILRRRWWLLVVLPALVGGLSWLTYTPPAPVYQYVIRLVVGVEPLEEDGMAWETDPRLAAAQASEYIADDLSVIVSETAFAQAVSARLGDLQVPPGAIAGATVAEKQHRILTITITWGAPEALERIGEAVVATLESEADRFLPLIGGTRTQIAVVGQHGPFPVGGGLRQKLDIPLRIVLALIAAVAFTFLWEYLDDTIRSRTDVERYTRTQLLSEIPRRSRRWR
ncbi:hypothetical protein ARMA_0040 [Ardenticatena maritima]|uniref:Polysaccharide chain length determinant N-terminal domain-containing protein n=1 Tax=Ardenticatena maritima TaxID=872965 RepID=A0A0M9UBC1_9CHLR|nr:hypothetical protein [Ardenticatena maritima]KPL88615.1 hypothetical protein SE16_07680 [Ardenticatena maritima]GAP61617.1 hypothetical protein ARMA_0040 [Ardenticatena maritima]